MAWRPPPSSSSPSGWERRRGARSWDRQILTYLLVATGIIISLSIVAGASADLRFAVFVWVLVMAGILVFLFLYQREVRAPPLEAPVEGDHVLQGQLERLAETLGRADRGMKFSQIVVARRVRQAFLTRVQQEYGLREAELEALLAAPTEFARLVKEPLIWAFLEDTAPPEETLLRQQAASGASSFRFVRGKDFTAGIATVLEAMEAWH